MRQNAPNTSSNAATRPKRSLLERSAVMLQLMTQYRSSEVIHGLQRSHGKALLRQTVNNFVAVRDFRFGFGIESHECCRWFGATGGPGILTTSRSNDCELYLPARRPRLDPLTTTQEAVLSTDDFSILPSQGQGFVPTTNKSQIKL